MRHLLILLSAVGLSGLTTDAASAGDLRLRVTGVRSDLGSVRVGLFDSQEAFDRRAPFLGKAVPARNHAVTVLIEGLQAGTYGIAFYHDEDNNNRHDKSFIGIPLEGYGFANDASGFMGPPDFEDMAVTVPAEGTVETEATLRYGIE